MAQAIFELIVMVDWSASSTPKSGADSIWIAAVGRSGAVVRLDNPRTRQEAFDLLVGVCAETSGRVLLGFDFPMGPPAGFTRRVVSTLNAEPVAAPRWRAIWELLDRSITDDERNRNNRCVVADALNRAAGERLYWGAPASQATEWLTSKKAKPSPFAARDGSNASDANEALPSEFRLVEGRLRSAGYRPFSWWQLFGAGSVGSQAMLGIPVLQRFRSHPGVGDRVALWPFQTGLELETATLADDVIVIAEMWPSSLPHNEIAAVDHPIKDARQVSALGLKLAAADRAGRLAEWFTADLDPADASAVCSEEGWVLGVDATGRPITTPTRS